MKKLCSLLRHRKPDTNKGDYGRLLIIAGSPGMTGAAILCGRGALRSGTGLVYLAVPRSLQDHIDAATPEHITFGLSETKQATLALVAVPEVLDLIIKRRIDAVVLGPGLSQNSETVLAIQQLIEKIKIPMLIDADGLNALAKNMALLKIAGAKYILTPHPGEFARLTGIAISSIQKKRSFYAKSFAKKHKVCLVLKGHASVVADTKGKVYVNDSGNPGMSSGGVGDVLSGMIGAFLAQGIEPFSAARLGVYAHGLAGDIVQKVKGEQGMLASDIVEMIPYTLEELKKHA